MGTSRRATVPAMTGMTRPPPGGPLLAPGLVAASAPCPRSQPVQAAAQPNKVISHAVGRIGGGRATGGPALRRAVDGRWKRAPVLVEDSCHETIQRHPALARRWR